MGLIQEHARTEKTKQNKAKLGWTPGGRVHPRHVHRQGLAGGRGHVHGERLAYGRDAVPGRRRGRERRTAPGIAWLEAQDQALSPSGLRRSTRRAEVRGSNPAGDRIPSRSPLGSSGELELWVDG